MTTNQERAHILKLLSKTARLDGRKFNEYRKPLTVECNVVKSAEGSARVKIGTTEVIAGVKMELGEPYPDTPNEGSLIVGVELLPIANPDFELGPPSIKAVELSRVVDRVIRESKAIDMEKLCITPGEKMWMAVIDICTINDAGNLFDACALAALAALKTSKFPALVDGKIDYKNLTDDEVPMLKTPISVTVHKIGKNLIIDPTTDEENASDARLTVGCLENGELCALQKGGDLTLSRDEVHEMCKLALEKSKELRNILG